MILSLSFESGNYVQNVADPIGERGGEGVVKGGDAHRGWAEGGDVAEGAEDGRSARTSLLCAVCPLVRRWW